MDNRRRNSEKNDEKAKDQKPPRLFMPAYSNIGLCSMSQSLSVFFLCQLLKLKLLNQVIISFQKSWMVHSYVDAALSRASPHGPLMQVILPGQVEVPMRLLNSDWKHSLLLLLLTSRWFFLLSEPIYKQKYVSLLQGALLFSSSMKYKY